MAYLSYQTILEAINKILIRLIYINIFWFLPNVDWSCVCMDCKENVLLILMIYLDYFLL